MSATMKAELSTPTDRTVRVERDFNAPRERVWQAMTEPHLIAQWWGRGNHVVVEKFDLKNGGHWRFVEHAADGAHGFEGRFGEIRAPERLVQTFEWDGMPTHVALQTSDFLDLGGERTRVVSVSLFLTSEDRNGMLDSGMETGMNESYAALDAQLT
jgi:uncharacterized protein YndB with AHSA1/START domain